MKIYENFIFPQSTIWMVHQFVAKTCQFFRLIGENDSKVGRGRDNRPKIIQSIETISLFFEKEKYLWHVWTFWFSALKRKPSQQLTRSNFITSIFHREKFPHFMKLYFFMINHINLEAKCCQFLLLNILTESRNWIASIFSQNFWPIFATAFWTRNHRYPFRSKPQTFLYRFLLFWPINLSVSLLNQNLRHFLIVCCCDWS